jgi:hypothetical protein
MMLYHNLFVTYTADTLSNLVKLTEPVEYDYSVDAMAAYIDNRIGTEYSLMESSIFNNATEEDKELISEALNKLDREHKIIRKFGVLMVPKHRRTNGKR